LITIPPNRLRSEPKGIMANMGSIGNQSSTIIREA